MIATILIPLLFIGTFGISAIVLLDSFLRARNCWARLRQSDLTKTQITQRQRPQPAAIVHAQSVSGNIVYLADRRLAKPRLYRQAGNAVQETRRPISPRFAAA